MLKVQHELPIYYHSKQVEIRQDPRRFKIVSKGRRFGFTKGMANEFIEDQINGLGPLLWVDTVNTNIERYVQRYFIPVLNHIPKRHWKWNVSKNKLTVMGQDIDFRSADRPENMEGFGYKKILLNEAGIILKNPLLWNESIRAMAMDYKATCIIGGKPKGKRARAKILNEPGISSKKEEHLFYTMFKRGQSDHPDWKDWAAFQYSSYDNSYLDPDEVAAMEKEVSPAIRDQEIGGKFLDSIVNKIVKDHWWKYYKELPPKFIRIIQSWDTAFKKNEENDYNVCTTWGETRLAYFLIHRYKARLEFPDLKRAVVSEYRQHRPNIVLVEDKASGQSLVQEIQRDTNIPILPIPKSVDKEAMLHSVTPLIESGRCYIPEPEIATFDVADYTYNLGEFPSAEFDDDVDSTSQALDYLRQSTGVVTEITTKSTRNTKQILEGYE